MAKRLSCCYSHYSALMYPLVSFVVFLDSAVFFTSSGTSSRWNFGLLTGYLHVKSEWCIARLHVEAIVMYRGGGGGERGGYSDSLDFLPN